MKTIMISALIAAGVGSVVAAVVTMALTNVLDDPEQTDQATVAWVVVGKNFELHDQKLYTLTVEYTTSVASKNGAWSWTWPITENVTSNPWWRCFDSVRVGDTIPDCIRSNDGLEKLTTPTPYDGRGPLATPASSR